MKLIYYCTPGYGDTYALSNEGISIYDGYYFFIDILNRKFFIPMSVSYLTEEEWDHNINYLPDRYVKALKELNDEETGSKKK